MLLDMLKLIMIETNFKSYIIVFTHKTFFKKELLYTTG